MFNYTNLRYFDSKGRELPLVYNAPKIVFDNPRHKDESGEYLVVTCDENCTEKALLKTKTGKRFLSSDHSIKCTYTSSSQTLSATTPKDYYNFVEYTTSSSQQECYFNFIPTYTNKLIETLNVTDLEFPSLKFESKMYFDKVSTGLVETKSLYILAESLSDTTHRNTPKYTTVIEHPHSTEFRNRYKLMFFIDCREQNNFRFFTVNNDEVVWSDRKFIDFNDGNNYAIGDTNSGYRVDLGFVGELDGLYEDTMYVFLIDTGEIGEYADEYNNYPGNAHLIGKINLIAEAEGEDERYRTFFDNFGVPDPKETYDAFKETDTQQESIDYIKVNDYSKKLYLAYDQIIPYIGTYKALINALDVLGYDDIFFKEWYKNINNKSSKLVAYDVAFKHNKNANTITNIPIEERIQLKKLNWLSMMYKITEETSDPFDMYGFPTVVHKSNYYDNGIIVKLISLRKYLEKYILGVNCRISDITGEGIVFERYNTYKYGTYQQVLEYNNEKGVNITVNESIKPLVDGLATIQAQIITSESGTSIEDSGNLTFDDFCEGYIDVSNGKFFSKNDNRVSHETDICVGKTIELNDNTNNYEIKYIGTCDSFRINNNIITNDSPSLLIDDGKISYDAYDLLTKHRNTVFKPNNLPIIQIKRGVIRLQDENDSNILKIDSESLIDNSISYTISNESITHNLQSTPTFMPPSHEGDNIVDGITKRKLKRWSDAAPFEFLVGTIEQNVNSLSYTPNIIHNETYGLRYCTDNKNNLPCFKIRGYVCSEIALNTPNTNLLTTEEYFLEILDGSMTFNDIANNRTITIDFSCDSETNDVNVSTHITKNTKVDNTYSYLAGNIYVKDLSSDLDLTTFVTAYNSYDYERAINHNPITELTFTNNGTYDLSVILYDQCNNIFTKKLNKKIVIHSPETNINLYTTEKLNQGATPCGDISNLKDNNDVCILPYEPKRALNDITVRANHKTEDDMIDTPMYHLKGSYDSNHINGLLKSSSKQYGQFAQISNTMDKFIVCGKTPDNAILLSKVSPENGHVYNTNGETDVYCILYNTVAEYPDTIIFGKICKENANYRFTFNLNSDMTVDGFMTIYNKPSYEIYIIPAWIFEVTLNNSSNKNTLHFKDDEFIFGNDVHENNLLKLFYKKDGMDSAGATLVTINQILRHSKDITLKKNVVNHTPDESYKFYATPIDCNFVSYIMKLDYDKSTRDIIYGDGSRITKNISQHIDKGFTASLREFDLSIAQRWYDSGYQNIQNITYKQTNNTTTKGVVAMSSGTINQTTRWRIHKRNKYNNNRTLMVECYNKFPIFDIKNTGLYDVELICYDAEGNKSYKDIKSAITVI